MLFSILKEAQNEYLDQNPSVFSVNSRFLEFVVLGQDLGDGGES